MPALTTSKNQTARFTIYMNTRDFVALWKVALADNQNWGEFLLGCWKRFSVDPKTVSSLNAYSVASGDDWKTWDDETIKRHISKRAYAKANTIRKKLKNYYSPSSQDMVPDLPMHAVQFYCKCKDLDRLTSEDIADLFASA